MKAQAAALLVLLSVSAYAARQEFAIAPAEVLSKAGASLKTREFTVTDAYPDVGTIRAQREISNMNDLACAAGPGTFVSAFEKIEIFAGSMKNGKTSVLVAMTGSATWSTPGGNVSRPCSSNGELEREILAEISSH